MSNWIFFLSAGDLWLTATFNCSWRSRHCRQGAGNRKENLSSSQCLNISLRYFVWSVLRLTLVEMKVLQKSSQNLWVFLLALLQLGHINTAMDLNAATGPLSRSAYTVVQGNKQLVGHVVKRFSAPSLIACSQSCLKNEWCTSTNFKNGEKFCELNMHEIAPGNIVHELTDQPGVTFSMYQKASLS